MRHSNLFCILIMLLTVFLSASFSSAMTPEKAEDFELKNIDGKTYRLSDLHGKVVLINFWATWCKYCIQENPSLERLYNEIKDDGFVVLGISIDRSVSTVKNYLLKNPLSYPILMDSKGEVFVKKYTVVGIPVSLIINREGYIVEKLPGIQHFDSQKLMIRIDGLLKTGS